MPPHIGDLYDDNLYLVHQDGSYAKLSDIKDFSIGTTPDIEYDPQKQYATGGFAPCDEYAIGGFVPYDEYTPPQPYHTSFVPPYFTAFVHLNISRKRLYMALLGMTKREMRLAIRRAERLRRDELKNSVRRDNRFAVACMDIINRRRKSVF